MHQIDTHAAESVKHVADNIIFLQIAGFFLMIYKAVEIFLIIALCICWSSLYTIYNLLRMVLSAVRS